MPGFRFQVGIWDVHQNLFKQLASMLVSFSHICCGWYTINPPILHRMLTSTSGTAGCILLSWEIGALLIRPGGRISRAPISHGEGWEF